jgi:DNA (cytosine-5)-methyltransferase 1
MDAMTDIISGNDQYKRSASGNLRRHTKTGWSRSLGLARTAKLWPTILASAGVGPSSKEIAAGDPKKRIDVAVQLWRTPVTSDCNGGAEEFVRGKNLRLTLRSQANTLYPCGLQDQTMPHNGPKYPHTLNPLFCEWLMGWPIGWTGFAPVGTALSHWRRRMHGELLRLTSR